MIQISRLLARQLRAVFRRLATRAPGVAPAVSFQADAAGLRVRLQRTPIAAEYRRTGAFGSGTVHVPIESLADCAGRDEGSVLLEATDLTRVSASWLDHGLPQVKHYPYAGEPLEFPVCPDALAAATPGLLSALADACQCTASASTRYALVNLQVRGKAGEIVATDGRQLLVQSGLAFPWEEDLLVPGSAVFGAKELADAGAASLGHTESQVALRVGPWTLYLPIDRGGRFPDVAGIAPADSKVATRCRLDPADAAFLRAALPRLPGAKDDFAPVTISLDQEVVVRARAGGDGPITELTLARSEHCGKAARFRTDRSYLARALELGFERLDIARPDVPMAFRAERRTYAFMPLGKDGAIAACDGALRISSAEVNNGNHTPPRRKQPVSTAPSEDGHAASTGAGHPDTSSNGAGAAPAPKKCKARREKSPTARGLIEEAVALRTMLREACVRSNALLAALKKQKQQSKLLKSTIASLRQLQQAGGGA